MNDKRRHRLDLNRITTRARASARVHVTLKTPVSLVASQDDLRRKDLTPIYTSISLMSASKSKSKQEEAQQLLDQLDSFEQVPAQGSSAAPAPQTSDDTDVLEFIDQITKKSSEPTRPAAAPAHALLDRPGSRASLRKSERVRVGSPAPHSLGLKPEASSSTASLSSSAKAPAPEAVAAPTRSGAWGGWGSGVWSSASAALQQAKQVVDDQMKQLPVNEQAKKWTEGIAGYVPVNKEQFEKLGMSFRAREISVR